MGILAHMIAWHGRLARGVERHGRPLPVDDAERYGAPAFSGSNSSRNEPSPASTKRPF
jgi:hypothetical protein